MKTKALFLFTLIISGTAVAESFLAVQQFPKTFDDLDFTEKQEFKTEDYALFSELSAYEKLIISYVDEEADAEITQDETAEQTNTTPVQSAQTQPTPSSNQTQTGAYCATKNPAIPAGQTIPIGKPVLESDYTYCSPYGVRNFGTKEKPKWDNHYGFDIGCTEKHFGRPVFTPANGTVELVKYNGYGSSAGNYIRINHGNGFTTYYMHLNTILVTRGQKVSAGCQIGTIGNTGGAKAFKEKLQTSYPTMSKNSSHLHYEMRYSGTETSVSGIPIKHGFSRHKSIDPAYFMGIKK